MYNILMDLNIDEIIDSLAASHKISSQEMFEILEKILIEAWTSVYGEGYNLSLEIQHQKIGLYRIVDVVEEVNDRKTQKRGEHIGTQEKELLTINNLPRNVIVGIYESIGREIKNLHKQREYEAYHDQVGKIFKYQVKKLSGFATILNIGHLYEGIIPANLANQRERFVPGEYIYCRLTEVKQYAIDYQLIFERRSAEFISGLVSEFIPEVQNKAVKVRSVSRDLGSLCKILVESEGSVNAVGACLGMKGQRRLEIMKELKGEKIEFIAYNSNIIYQIKECFKSKKIDVIKVNAVNENEIEVVIPDDKMAEAIGKNGQNIYLLKKLLDKQIILVTESDYKAQSAQNLLEEAQMLKTFDIEEEDAINILQKFKNIEHALASEEINDQLKQKIAKYIEYQKQEDENYYIESGGDPEFYMCINHPRITSEVYFKLLEFNIGSIGELSTFGTAEDLHKATNIDIDLCVIIMAFIDQNI